MSKILQLEKLVASNGDPNLIRQLRAELGMGEEVEEKKREKQFDVGQYKKWKRAGVPDRVIAEELGMSDMSLYRLKLYHGLVIRKGVQE